MDKNDVENRIIINNHSSRPLYEIYEKAFDAYFQEWSEEQPDYALVYKDYVFYVKTNKKSISVSIYDNER